MEILVTGALGVNGSAVLRNFCARQIRPIVFENRIDLSLVQDLVGQFEVIQGDINDLVALIRVLQKHKIQRLVHMAALMPPAAEADRTRGLIVNALGTVNVLEAASLTGVERVVFTSSALLRAGDRARKLASRLHARHRGSLPESGLGVRRDEGRQRGHGTCLRTHIRDRVRFPTVREHLWTGKLARHGRVSLHSKIIESAMAGVPVRLRQGSEQKADMIYVDDVAQGIVLATLVDRVPHPAYNISTGRGETIVEFADAVKAVIPGANIEVGPGLDFFEYGAPGGYYLMDPTLAREDLGFEAHALRGRRAPVRGDHAAARSSSNGGRLSQLDNS